MSLLAPGARIRIGHALFASPPSPSGSGTRPRIGPGSGKVRSSAPGPAEPTCPSVAVTKSIDVAYPLELVEEAIMRAGGCTAAFRRGLRITPPVRERGRRDRSCSYVWSPAAALRADACYIRQISSRSEAASEIKCARSVDVAKRGARGYVRQHDGPRLVPVVQVRQGSIGLPGTGGPGREDEGARRAAYANDAGSTGNSGPSPRCFPDPREGLADNCQESLIEEPREDHDRRRFWLRRRDRQAP
jgi:hypothetical protein